MAQWGLLREPDDTHLTPRVDVKVGGENRLRYECARILPMYSSNSGNNKS